MGRVLAALYEAGICFFVWLLVWPTVLLLHVAFKDSLNIYSVVLILYSFVSFSISYIFFKIP